MTETELIERAREGSEAAWVALVAEHQEAVYRLAYLLLGNAHDAEDAAQETFVSAFRALDRFELGRPLRPWLLKIVSNIARNQRRSLGRYVAAVRRLMGAVPERAPGITGGSIAGLEAEVLWQAVRRLSRADQEIIYMRYFLDLSEAETVAALGVAPGTVKSRLHRALDRLRVVIEREFPGLREGREV